MINRILQILSRCPICNDPHGGNPLWEHYRFTVLATLARFGELSVVAVLLIVFAWFCFVREEEKA